MKILIVEDDRALNNGIALSFSDAVSLQAFTLEEARRLLDDSVDLMILDINLPDGSGLSFCREVRQADDVPILILTANDTEMDIVAGLESGADDYVTKPFALAVLRARVNAVLRRKVEKRAVFQWGDYLFDFDKMVFYVGNVPVELSKAEQKLLKALTANKGITLSRAALIEHIWPGEAEFVEENALSVAMRRLRSKLPGLPIKTVYGIGYRWEGVV